MFTELPVARRALAVLLSGFVCLLITGVSVALDDDPKEGGEKTAAGAADHNHDDHSSDGHAKDEKPHGEERGHGDGGHGEEGHSREAVLHGKVGEEIRHPAGMIFKVKTLDNGEVELVVTEHHPEGPIEWFTDLALWSLVTFLLFFFVLAKFAWGPLAAGLDHRDAMIRKNIADAESAMQAAQKLLADHTAKLDQVQEEVREILAEARRDAEHTSQEIKATAEKEANAARDRAVQDIQRVKDQALDELFSHFATTVSNATEHVIGRSLSGADDERLISEAVSQFASRQ